MSTEMPVSLAYHNSSNSPPLSPSCSTSITSSDLTSPSLIGKKDSIIPTHWCKGTQDDRKQLKWTARCDIVRTLGTLLVANHGPNPTNVLERPDNYEQRTGSYLAISADIKNYCE